MPRNVVTTELVADQPVVVVLHHDQKALKFLLQRLSQESITLEAYSISELLQSPSIQQRVAESYKIAWLTSTEDFVTNAQELEMAHGLLFEHQHKLTFFFSVISSFSEQVSGEFPYASQFFSAQTEAVLFHNSFAPSATFLFGQDIVSSEVATSFLYLLSQHLGQGMLFAPRTPFHPQSLESYLHRAVRYFLQPQRASILIRGNSVHGSRIASEMKQLYQSYHFSLVDIQEVVVTAVPTIPFSVVENFVTDDVLKLVTTFVQSLPTPTSMPKTTILKRLFGDDTRTTAEFGTEVMPPQEETVQPQVEETTLEETVPSSVPVQDVQVTEPEPVSPEPEPTPDIAASSIVSQEDTDSKPAQKTPPENFDLNQEIQNIFSTTHVSHKNDQVKRIQQKKHVITTKTKKRTAVFYGGLAFTGMGLGILCLAVVFVFSVNILRNSVTKYLVENVQAEEATVADTGQLDSILRMKSVVNVQTETYSLLLSLPALEDAKNLVELSSNLQSVADNSAEADQLTEKLYLQAVGMDSGDVVTTAQNLNNKALTAYESLSQFYEKLTTFVGSAPSSEVSTSLENYQKELEFKRTGIQSMQQLSPLFANMLGVNGKRTYAFILQNNQELRPTGGFIEDVALLTFENGSLISAAVYSGYEVDSQMNGTVIPPEGIQQYLNEEGWNFVDGNWNPHFPETATQLSWFIEKSMGVVVDGVITIDLDGLATVLEAAGPLDMPQYNEVLTHKNVQDRFEFHSEISLVDAKEDYRKQVFQAFINKISTLPKEKIVPFFGALQKSVASQHMLLAFKDADELNTVKTLGWSGSLLQPNCPSQLSSPNCVVDTSAQVEANVGINKANYYLKRTIDHSVALEATQAAHSRSIIFENTAQTESWPKGPYKTYIRLYVPSSALPGSITIDGTAIPENSISISEETNRKVIGFYVEVPVKQTKNVRVNYVVPYSNPGSGFSYTFFEQQQPGTGATPFTLRVTSYSGLRPAVIAPQASFENGVITFTKETVEHGFFGVKYN
ncbi:MAG: hypothetical protein QG639_725 [Patescibacteria group bacterium]|nr:hypothetical protein [Patescibacteria group bacterium]